MQALFIEMEGRRYAIDASEILEVLPMVEYRAAQAGPAHSRARRSGTAQAQRRTVVDRGKAGDAARGRGVGPEV